MSRVDLGSSPRIWLAPMEGVVDPVVRDLFTQLGGIDACVTEFIRVTDRRLPDAEFYKFCPELRNDGRTANHTPVLLQLLGGQPGPMAENAARAAELGAPGIDLNFGCPAKTVNRHDGGAALLKNPQRVYDVTHTVRTAVPENCSVSAKVRLGFSDKSLFLDIAQAAESAGASWLTVHARTRDEGYRPPAHWEYIARIREALKIPVIANGEIWTVDDYHRCRSVTGCQDVMIGRGLIARPDLAAEIKSGRPALSWPAMIAFLLRFTLASREFRHADYAVARTKQMLRSFCRNWPQANLLFETLKRLELFDDLYSLLLEQARVAEPIACD